MRTETPIIVQMRETVRAALPPKAFLRRDRGDALFITNAPALEPCPTRIDGFILEPQGPLLRIYPDESWISRLEQSHPEPADSLGASLIRFRERAPDREGMLLFIRCLKLLDAGRAAAGAEIEACDRALRQRAAVALRGGCGGGLYAAAILMRQINTLYKGENQI